MSDNTNMSPYAEACIESALYGVETLDVDALREAARDHVGENAEDACIYTHNCYAIINRYESEVNDSDIDDLVTEQEYKATDWRDAMTAYANAIAYQIIGAKVEESVDAIESAVDHLVDAGQEWGAEDIDAESLRISSDCPHGWAVHDKEDAEGVHFWSEGELEGCRAVAFKVEGFWLSYTWTPSASTPSEES